MQVGHRGRVRLNTLTGRGHTVWIRAVDRLLGSRRQRSLRHRGARRVRCRHCVVRRGTRQWIAGTDARDRCRRNVLHPHGAHLLGESGIHGAVDSAAEHRRDLRRRVGQRADRQAVRPGVRRGRSAQGGHRERTVRPHHVAADVDLDRRVRWHDGVVGDPAHRAGRRDHPGHPHAAVVRLLLGPTVRAAGRRRSADPGAAGQDDARCARNSSERRRSSPSPRRRSTS